VRHHHGAIDDRRTRGVARQPPHEGAVDLDRVDRQLEHRLQRGVPRAVVVEVDAAAEGAQRLQHRAQPVGRHLEVVLRELQVEVGRADPVPLQLRAQEVDEADVFQLER
jgi:hypothetical protein